MALDTDKLSKLTSGLEYTASYVPFEQSRNSGADGGERWESLNWRIRLLRNGVTLETDYGQGVRHLPDMIRQRLNLDNRPCGAKGTAGQQQELVFILERGRDCRWFEGRLVGATRLPPPSLPDVLSCLLMDAEALDFPSFEDWAEEFGYGADSRKAEQAYRQCLDIGLKLRRMFGDATLQELRELFQDY